MKRRIIAAIVAMLLAGLGAIVLLAYVGNADRRAMAGMQPVDVLVVSELVPAGTTAEALGKLVTTEPLPAMAVAKDALSSLTPISGQVTTTDLQPGEQVLASRFVDPASLTDADVPIPEGLQQLTLLLDQQRVLGGRLSAGSTVGVFISLPKDGEYLAQTHLMEDSILVTRVDSGSTTLPPDGGDAPAAGQGEAVMVTVAVSSTNAETLIYGAEHGTLWLSLRPADVEVRGTRVVTRANVNK